MDQVSVALLLPRQDAQRRPPQGPGTSPVDYRNGTVHIRAEVIEKPEGGAPTTWTLCYIPNKGLKTRYGCTGTGVYKEKGVTRVT